MSVRHRPPVHRMGEKVVVAVWQRVVVVMRNEGRTRVGRRKGVAARLEWCGVVCVCRATERGGGGQA